MTVQELMLLPPELRKQITDFYTSNGITISGAANNISGAAVNTYDAQTGGGDTAVLNRLTKTRRRVQVMMKFKNDTANVLPFYFGDILGITEQSEASGSYLWAYDGTMGANTHAYVQKYLSYRSCVISEVRLKAPTASLELNGSLFMSDFDIDRRETTEELPVKPKFIGSATQASYLNIEGNISTDGVHRIKGFVAPGEEVIVTLFISAVEGAYAANAIAQ